MCNQCNSDTRLSGLKELDGLCISCWRDKAIAADSKPSAPEGLLDDIDELKRMYGNNLAIAPGAVQRIVAYADKARGRDAGGVDTAGRPTGVRRKSRV